MLLPRRRTQDQRPGKVLDALVFQVHAKAKELRDLSSQASQARDKVRAARALRAEHEAAARVAESARYEHQRAADEAKRAAEALARKGAVLREDIAAKANEAQAATSEVEILISDLVSGKKTMSELRGAFEIAALKLSELHRSIDNLTRSIVDLKGEEAAWSAKIDALKSEREKIMGDIEKSIEKFHVFESRIAAFSKETGYMVGHPVVSKPTE